MTQAENVGLVAMPVIDRGGEWRIGADVLLQSVYEWEHSPEVVRWSLSGAVTWQIRNETTLERVLRSVNLAPQFVAVLLSLGAQVVGGDSEGLLADYVSRTNALPAAPMITITPADGTRKWGWASVSRTPADQPIVAVVACVTVRDGIVTEAGLVLAGVWAQLVGAAQAADLLRGAPLTDETIARVAAAVEEEVSPSGNYLGSQEYRRSMAGVLVRRALNDCLKGVSG